MRARYFMFPLFFALLIGVVAVVWVIARTPPPLVLEVREFRIGRAMMFEIAGPQIDVLGPQIGDRYAYAHIQASNSTKRPLVFLSHTRFSWPRRDCLPPTRLFGPRPTGGWVERPRKAPAANSWGNSIAPRETFGFWALIDSTGPCRVGLDCTEARSPTGVWRRLPQWLTKGIFSGQNQFTAMTEIIHCADWERRSNGWLNVVACYESDGGIPRFKGMDNKAWHAPFLPESQAPADVLAEMRACY